MSSPKGAPLSRPRKSDASSRLLPESTFCTEVDWEITLDKLGDATHSIYIKIKNLQHRKPSQLNLSLEFIASDRVTHSHFRTAYCDDSRTQVVLLDDTSAPGPGYDSDKQRLTYTLPSIEASLKEAQEGREAALTTFHVAFNSQNMLVETEPIYVFLLLTKLKLHSNRIDINILLPQLNRRQRIVTWLRNIRKEKFFYSIAEFQILSSVKFGPRIDKRLGSVRYTIHEDDLDIYRFAFYYEKYKPIRLRALIVSFVLGVVTTVGFANDLLALWDRFANWVLQYIQ